jgi:hypothetical protein
MASFTRIASSRFCGSATSHRNERPVGGKLLQHLDRRVDADDLTGAFGEWQCVQARTAPDVGDPIAGSEVEAAEDAAGHPVDELRAVRPVLVVAVSQTVIVGFRLSRHRLQTPKHHTSTQPTVIGNKGQSVGNDQSRPQGNGLPARHVNPHGERSRRPEEPFPVDLGKVGLVKVETQLDLKISGEVTGHRSVVFERLVGCPMFKPGFPIQVR